MATGGGFWVAAGDGERLDVFNGLLLAAHLDAAFDAGLIAIDVAGIVLVSAMLDGPARAVLGLVGEVRVHGIQEAHGQYLGWQRANLFERVRPTSAP